MPVSINFFWTAFNRGSCKAGIETCDTDNNFKRKHIDKDFMRVSQSQTNVNFKKQLAGRNINLSFYEQKDEAWT